MFMQFDSGKPFILGLSEQIKSLLPNQETNQILFRKELDTWIEEARKIGEIGQNIKIQTTAIYKL